MAENTCFDEFQIYHACIIGSIVFTLALSIYAKTQGRFEDAPQKGMKIYFVCGTIKIILGALMWTVLYPVDCPGYVNVYGAIAIIIGIFWIIRGNGLRNADVSAQPSGGAEMTTPRGDYV